MSISQAVEFILLILSVNLFNDYFPTKNLCFIKMVTLEEQNCD